MPESTFNFDIAVAAAQRDYSEETKNVTFIDVASPTGREQLRAWWSAASDEFRYDWDPLIFMTEEDPGCIVDAATGKKVMIFNSNFDTASFLGPSSKADVLDFVFNHELGHLVARHGLADEKTKSGADKDVHNRAEMAGDCFGALRSLSQGTITAEEIRRLSFRRSIAGDTSHATAQAIDAMLKDAEDKKTDFTKLTLDEVKDMAAWYAEKYSATQNETDRLKNINVLLVSLPRDIPPRSSETEEEKKCRAQTEDYVRKTKQQWLENMADICEKSADNSFAFYTTAKTLSVILATGKEPYTGRAFDITDKKWDKIRDNIKQRAAKIGVRNLLFK